MDVKNWLQKSGEEVLRFKQKESAEKGWTTRRDVLFMRNPDITCPWCGIEVPSGRLWILSTERSRLVGVWDIKTGQKIPWLRQHPHAHPSNGRLCMGDSSDPVQVITRGLNPSNAYWQTSLFMKMIGHVCPLVRSDSISRGGPGWRLSSEPPLEESREGFHECDFCQRQGKIEEMKFWTMHGNLCKECLEANFFECYSCKHIKPVRSKSRPPHRDGYYYCNSCY